MDEIKLNTSELKERAGDLRAGQRVLLSGTAYTSRDAAHKRITEMLDRGEEPPYSLSGAAIYYAGPTPAPEGMPIGSCGPTTSARMDPYTPRFLDLGLRCMIGKGGRSKEVIEAMKRNGAVYLCAVGGAGGLAGKCISMFVPMPTAPARLPWRSLDISFIAVCSPQGCQCPLSVGSPLKSASSPTRSPSPQRLSLRTQ